MRQTQPTEKVGEKKPLKKEGEKDKTLWKRRRERKTPIEKEGEKKKPYWQKGEEENNLLTKKTYWRSEEKNLVWQSEEKKKPTDK